ncbi:MAG: aminotransferase class V-fold PLP-dependent enzyme [Gemmatimonadales bacterium]|nr:MAG: aminotransferase class V-fold PLP-dependent enzyme [Gemmatimonadales bacterium]
MTPEPGPEPRPESRPGAVPGSPAPLDVEALRRDTPGTAFGIHLNNAGAALQPAAVLKAVHDHLQAETELGGYEAAAARADEIAGAYRSVEELLGARQGSIAFTENATVAFQQALSSIRLAPGDRILTSRQDYVSNQLMYLSLAERLGVEVERAPDAPEGGIDVGAVREALIRRRPRVVALSHIPTSSGVVQDAGAVGALCREHGVPYILDACQSVGQMPLEPESLGCSFLAATSRKFLRGPRGAGFLWVSRQALKDGLVPLFPDLRSADWVEEDLWQPAPDASRFENWEFSWALVLGTGAAAEVARATGLEAIRDRARSLAHRLREGLGGVRGVQVLDRGRELAAIVTITVEGWRPSDLVRHLRERSIRTSSVDRSSAVIDYDERGIPAALRLSPHAYNTEDEIDEAVEALRHAASFPRESA